MGILKFEKFKQLLSTDIYYHSVDTSCSLTADVCVRSVMLRRLIEFQYGQSIWDLWWTEWKRDRFYCQYVGFPCQCRFIMAPYLFIQRQRHIILATDVVVK
jgi:hypothetical protein